MRLITLRSPSRRQHLHRLTFLFLLPLLRRPPPPKRRRDLLTPDAKAPTDDDGERERPTGHGPRGWGRRRRAALLRPHQASIRCHARVVLLRRGLAHLRLRGERIALDLELALWLPRRPGGLGAGRRWGPVLGRGSEGGPACVRERAVEGGGRGRRLNPSAVSFPQSVLCRL